MTGAGGEEGGAAPSASERATASRAASLWRHGDFLRLWGAQSVSSLGARVAREGLPMAAVLALGAGPGAVGLLAAIRGAPSLVVGLAAGGMVDRARRRDILIACDLARAAALLVIPLAALAHRLAMAELWLVAAVVAALSDLFDMADHAYLPSLVDRGALMDANAKMSATESVAEIGGPALAGVLFTVLTAPIALAASAVTYLASAGLLATIKTAERPGGSTAPAGRWPADAVVGLRAAWTAPTVRPLLLMGVTTGLFGGFFSAGYIVFALETAGLTPALLGLTIAVGGVGALIGSALAAPLARALGLGPALIAAGLASAASAALIPLAGGSAARATAFLMAAQLFGDSFGVAALIYAKTLRQSLLPGEVMGRVAGVFAASAGAAAALGALAAGPVSAALGVRGMLFAGAAGLTLAFVWPLASPLRATRRVPQEAPRA